MQITSRTLWLQTNFQRQDPSQLSQLLRQRAGSNLPIQFTDSTIYRRSVNASATFLEEGHAQENASHSALHSPDALAFHSPREPRFRRVHFDSKHVKPSLPKQNTAPTSTGFVKQCEGTGKMYQTFDGVMDMPGDTQPDSQMFKQYTSGLMDSNSNLVPNFVVANELSADPPTDDIDMLGSSQSQPNNTIASPTVVHDDPETQFRDIDPLTSPLKFETPAVAGRKRNSQGQILSSAMRTNTTPGTVLSASAFFGFGNGPNESMSLTQAFNATQARTSPLVEASAEDPVFQRPSPNFINTRQRHSSPPAAMSSPIKEAVRTHPAAETILRSSSEPRADYETLKQSQERRKRELRHEDTWTSVVTQDSWEEPTAVQQRFIKRKAKEKLDQEAALSLASISAPTPSARRGKKRGLLSMSANYQSPQKTKTRPRAAFDGPNDYDIHNNSSDELSQPGPLTEDPEADSLDELSQDVPSSARAPPKTPIVKEASADNRVQVPNTSSHPLLPGTLSGQSARNFLQPDTPSSQLQRESHIRAPASQPLRKNIAMLKSSKESEVIMDSQPQELVDIPRPPKALRFPSSPSTNQYSINQTVMQSQSGYTSPAISSSMPPMPPRSSSQEQAKTPEKALLPAEVGEAVPSSPPIVSQEDISYDEHAYDEHFDTGEEARDVHDAREDTDVDDDEGLPIAQNEASTEEEGFQDETPVVAIKGDIDAGKPVAEDIETRNDDEVPETIEQEQSKLHDEEEELIRSSIPEDDLDKNDIAPTVPPRKQRQSTIPETDTLDETQPSFFPELNTALQIESHGADSAAHDGKRLADTNSTGHFYTGREQQSASQPTTIPDGTTKDDAFLQSPVSPQVRSLLDIANQPDTQRSTEFDVIDMPQLSFAAEPEDPLDAMISASSPARPTKKRKVTYSTKKKPFRSPIKETDPLSEQAPSSPLKKAINEPDWSPPSAPTQERENRGALAAARAREEVVSAQPATLKSKLRIKSGPSHTPRKGALKPVDRAFLIRSPGIPESTLVKTTEQGIQPRSTIEVPAVNVSIREADADDSEVDELAGPPPVVSKQYFAVQPASDDGQAPTGDLLNPNRVLAPWPAGHFYPATCLGRYDATHLRIRYDYDDTIHEVASTSLRALDLRTGDQVKLDIKGMKTHSYVVVGFKNKINVESSTEEYPSTDQRGYATVVVEQKERSSFPTAKKGQSQKRLEAQISSIYLTKSLWSRIRDRTYQYIPSDSTTSFASRSGTPNATNEVPTPTYLRRSIAKPSLLRDSTTRATSVASSVRSSGTMFNNMVFAVTLMNESSNKDAIIKLITSNGGQILDAGFYEMFEANPANAPASSEATVEESYGLFLKDEYKNVGFAALISDAHSRRPKHFQALALNLPILHLRWIQDSLSAARPVPFAKYLLPAGISTYLDPEGVIRSRTMSTYDPSEGNVNLLSMIDGRELLLQTQNVLLVASKKELADKEVYMFLTRALGASAIAHCKDLASAKTYVEKGDWYWVYVNGGAAGVADAASKLFDDGKGTVAVNKKSGGRKRKRDESTKAEVLMRGGMVGEKKVRITCDEFVIQSLILGALIDE
jgi:hypothetical protein